MITVKDLTIDDLKSNLIRTIVKFVYGKHIFDFNVYEILLNCFTTYLTFPVSCERKESEHITISFDLLNCERREIYIHVSIDGIANIKEEIVTN